MFFGQFAEASCESLELKLFDYKDADIKAFVKLAGLGSHHQQHQPEVGLIMDAVRACAAPAMLLVDKYQAMGLKRLCREAGAFPHSSGYTAKDKLLIKFEQGCESAGKTIACSERNV